ncbi:ATP-dependent helicase [Patescibacteria group bacterium]
MKNYLEQLNQHQKEAVIQKDGPILILAGAGAGKTKTLTHRILHLIKEGVAPSSILAVTFTNKAAKEMQERIDKLLREDRNLNLPVSGEIGWGKVDLAEPNPPHSEFAKPFISTFHSLGVHILKQNHKLLDIPRHFTIFDKDDSKKAVKEAVLQSDLDPKQFEPKKILNIISNQKGDFITEKEYSSKVGDEYFPQIISKVWSKYEKILSKEKALDFDDLLLKTALLLKNNSEVLNHYQNIWKYIHIDEYQDTNKVQYEISKLLSMGSGNICVVGDGDQSIYGWRGADINNILNFEEDYPAVKNILLEENYRSTQNILAAANKVIKKNKQRKEKNLFTKRAEGEKISLYSAYNEMDEAHFIAKKSQELIENGSEADEIAVLYRANFQSRALEEAFLSHGVPYQVLGTKFFDRKEIKDIVSFIKASLNPEGTTDIKRIINVPPRGIGKVTLLKMISEKKEELNAGTKLKVDKFYNLLEKIHEFALANKTSDLIKFILTESGLEEQLKNKDDESRERLDNIKEFVTLATKYDFLPPEEALEKLLEDVALSTDQDNMEKNSKAVKLMTVHASKGLEFENVFVTGLEDGLFPSVRDGKQTENEKEEERRLFYVAITRACKKLFLTHASVRTVFGTKQVNLPSEFLSDINEELTEDEDVTETMNNGDSSEKTVYLEW